MTQTITHPAPAADQKTLWLDEEIWPEIIAMMHGDAYFRLWLKANEIAKAPHGPIVQTIVNGYATYQLAAIRRLCDRRSKNDVISLPKVLKMIGDEQPHKKDAADALAARLHRECAAPYALATQYVAHNGDPATRNWPSWTLTSEMLRKAQKAICEVATIIERDLLAIRQRAHLVPVLQGDYLAEVKSFVPVDKLPALQDFWHSHHAGLNDWVRVPRVI